MPSVKSSDSISSVTDLLTDLEVDLSTDFRAYPSIKDYYIASSTSSTRSIQLQSGLSNYSGLVLGDDRISVSKSVANATYGPTMTSFDLPSLEKSMKTRRAEYLEASRRVGSAEVDRLEGVMKNKFIQRSSKNSSLYRVNNAFKFFDREESYRIPIEGFIRALEFLGFQFSDAQHLALFARYDNEFEGEIMYAQFISNAMFPSPSDDMMPPRVAVDVLRLSAYSLHEEEKGLPYNQLMSLQEAEMQSIFNKIDRNDSGLIDDVGLDLLLSAIGNVANASEITSYLYEMGVGNERVVSFDVFYTWWCEKALNASCQESRK